MENQGGGSLLGKDIEVVKVGLRGGAARASERRGVRVQAKLARGVSLSHLRRELALPHARHQLLNANSELASCARSSRVHDLDDCECDLAGFGHGASHH